jgi:hypothetical protein
MLLLCWMLSLLYQPPTPNVLTVTAKENAAHVEVCALLSKDAVKQLAPGKLSQDDGEKLLEFRLITDGKAGPAMLGAYRREGEKLLFVPRFPLQPEKTYEASFIQTGAKPVTVTYKVAARPAGPLAEVVAAWPASDVLPANQLRFYIQFSRPMRGGPDIFRQICLVDADGKIIDDPWFPDELWSDDGTFLTLYIHPGRIKWGVLLRLLLGPVLEPNRNYTLIVSGDMLDADDRKLAKEFRKPFRTTAEDRTRIELSAWKLQSPKTGQREAVALAFPKPLDHRNVQRFVKVLDAKGQPVAGKVEVGKDGRSWKFVPEMAWTNQEYKIAVDAKLEDIAGNTPVLPFDVDADAPVLPPQRLWLAFRPLP